METPPLLQAPAVAPAGAAPHRRIDELAWLMASRVSQMRNEPSSVLVSTKKRPFEARARSGRLPEPFAVWHDHEEPERFGCVTGPAFIEPDRGCIITPSLQVVAGPVIEGPPVQPGFGAYLGARLGRRFRRVPEVLNVRRVGEANYYHALVDVIGGRLRLADDQRLSRDLPLVISAHFQRQPYFAEVVRNSPLRDRDLIVQDGEFLRSERVWFGRAARYCEASAEYIQEFFDVPAGDRAARRRILVLRDPASRRGFDNVADVVDVASSFGFEAVDPADLTFTGQMELFSQARHVIGAHGAGLTNIVFRRDAPLSLLEIFPPNVPRLRAEYFSLATALGFDYSPLEQPSPLPGPADYQHSFPVDLDRLGSAIRSMLDRAD